MRRLLRGAAMAALLLAAGCGGGVDRAAPGVLPAAGWRATATEADRTRVRRWRDAWVQALAKVADPADRARLAAEGALLQPDASLGPPHPPAGEYRCRVTKIGAQGPGGLDYVAYPAFTCRIVAEGGGLRFAKIDGSQRPVGRLFADEGRMIFLGTMILGDETRALDYGRDPDRDVVGLIERVGAQRWRLVMPFPRWESIIDVMELVPAG